APDLVAEILSPGNSAIEMERKFELYRKAGVREYWVIEPEHQILHAYRFEGDRIFTRSFSRYDTAAVDSFPSLSIALEPVFAE
ncbi:MAG: Uma2 family endonuclease, partial [Treponema sp.]|nr:Uma2 family endonuclease [Treponema sp.]